MRSSKIRFLAAVTLLAAAGTGFGCGAATASSPQLVYVCQQVPCWQAQEFQVRDGHGAPIFSVGEYGGAGVFGDNLSFFPSDVFHPGLVLSPFPPAAYDREFGLPYRCRAPERWIAPQGNWHCTAAGSWARG